MGEVSGMDNNKYIQEHITREFKTKNRIVITRTIKKLSIYISQQQYII